MMTDNQKFNRRIRQQSTAADLLVQELINSSRQSEGSSQDAQRRTKASRTINLSKDVVSMPNDIHISPGTAQRRSRKARTQSMYNISNPSNNQGEKVTAAADIEKTDKIDKQGIMGKYLTTAGDISPIREPNPTTSSKLSKESIVNKLTSELRRLQNCKQSGNTQVETTKLEINKFFTTLQTTIDEITTKINTDLRQKFFIRN